MPAPRKPFCVITTDPERGLLLAWGCGIAPILAHPAWSDRGAQWSSSGRGWVLPLTELDDLTAELELRHVGYRLRERGDGDDR